MGNLSVHFTPFCCELKIALKNKYRRKERTTFLIFEAFHKCGTQIIIFEHLPSFLLILSVLRTAFVGSSRNREHTVNGNARVMSCVRPALTFFH